MRNVSGGLSPAVRRCALLLAGAGSAVLAVATPLSTDAFPLVGFVASSSCTPSAMPPVDGHSVPSEACQATLTVTPSTSAGPSKVDAVVECSAHSYPELIPGIDQTGVYCSVVGADGILYFAGSDYSPEYQPGIVEHELTGLPPQVYQLCVEGIYEQVGVGFTYGGLICNTSNAVVRP